MTLDKHTQKLLEELGRGKEINWDYVPELVENGQITREGTMSSLKSCLSSVIPKYRKMAETGDGRYWRQRLAEAQTALQAVWLGQEVKYRGIKV